MAQLLDNVDAKRFSVIQCSKNYSERYKKRAPPNTRCWWCKDLLVEVPLGCPCVSHSSKPVGKTVALGMRRCFHLRLRGLFCSYECVAAHAAHENRDSTTLSQQLVDIRAMRLFLQKVAFDAPLKPSPDWALLKIFGGPLSREDFRRIQRSSRNGRAPGEKPAGEEAVLVERPPIILLPQDERCLLRETSKQISSTLRYMAVPPRRPDQIGGTIPVPSDPPPPLGGDGGAPKYRVSKKRRTIVSSARLPQQNARRSSRGGKNARGAGEGRKGAGGAGFGGLIRQSIV